MNGTPSPAPAGLRLDDAQRALVEHGSGPMVALGGPGTGKTTVLEERFVRLATAPDCSPDRILFLVPNRAQKIALQDRLTHRLLFDEGLAAVSSRFPSTRGTGSPTTSCRVTTTDLGYSEPPVLLTSPEQWGDVRDALDQRERGQLAASPAPAQEPRVRRRGRRLLHPCRAAAAGRRPARGAGADAARVGRVDPFLQGATARDCRQRSRGSTTRRCCATRPS